MCLLLITYPIGLTAPVAAPSGHKQLSPKELSLYGGVGVLVAKLVLFAP